MSRGRRKDDGGVVPPLDLGFGQDLGETDDGLGRCRRDGEVGEVCEPDERVVDDQRHRVGVHVTDQAVGVDLAVGPVEIERDDFRSRLDGEQKDLVGASSELEPHSSTAQWVPNICAEEDAGVARHIRCRQGLDLEPSFDDPAFALRDNPGLDEFDGVRNRFADILGELKALTFNPRAGEFARLRPLLDIRKKKSREGEVFHEQELANSCRLLVQDGGKPDFPQAVLDGDDEVTGPQDAAVDFKRGVHVDSHSTSEERLDTGVAES